MYVNEELVLLGLVAFLDPFYHGVSSIRIIGDQFWGFLQLT